MQRAASGLAVAPAGNYQTLRPDIKGTKRMRESFNVYSYIVSTDSGFAPNPFGEFCTLSCCKPVIRRSASVGDWVVGLAPKSLGNGIVFAMEVTEKMTITE